MSYRSSHGITGLNETRLRNEALRGLQGDGLILYAVRCPDGVIKIGATGDVARRLKHIDHAEILALRYGTRADELAIHHSLKAHRHHGREWYHPTPEVLAVVNDMRDDFGLPHLAA